MNRIFCLVMMALLMPMVAIGQSPEEGVLRIIAFGAHPDDCELAASGVAAQWAAQGHAVKFVSMTNGDIGHFGMAGGPLAKRRKAEVESCAEVLGITTEVLDIHDGELMPSLENRKKVARLIRDWQADIVLVHRRYDYHADHRYSGVLVDDAIVIVEAPFFTPDTPPLPRSPVVMYYRDRFQKPYPFEPTLVVSIDEAIEKKMECLSKLPSQFSDVDSWTWGRRDDVLEDEEARMESRLSGIKRSAENVANTYRERLVALYGERGNEVRYAEAFELSEFGRRPSVDELKRLFPSFKKSQSGLK